MISVYVPAYNEEKHIKDTVLSIIRATKDAGNILLDIIIVDDGSTDSTPQIIDSLEKEYAFVRSIHHSKNKGLGEGLKECINIAKYPKFSIVHGDDSLSEHSMREIFKNASKADVIFVYVINIEIRSRIRCIISRIFNIIYLTIFDVYVQYISGACVFPTEKLKSFRIRSKRFSYIAELGVKSLKSGCSYYEIPVSDKRGTDGSTSLSLKNLFEVITTFLFMILDVYFLSKNTYNKSPKRIINED